MQVRLLLVEYQSNLRGQPKREWYYLLRWELGTCKTPLNLQNSMHRNPHFFMITSHWRPSGAALTQCSKSSNEMVTFMLLIFYLEKFLGNDIHVLIVEITLLLGQHLVPNEGPKTGTWRFSHTKLVNHEDRIELNV